MPTYQYQCTECAHALEVRQSFSDDALTVCPECEGRLRKVFNAVGVVFKGSGFYRNDSRSQTPSGGSGESSSSSSDGGKESAGSAGKESSGSAGKEPSGSGSSGSSASKESSSTSSSDRGSGSAA